MRNIPGDTMTARDRILATMNGDDVDRVPIFELVQHNELLESVTGERVTPKNGLDLLCAVLSQYVDMTRGVGPPIEDVVWQDDEGFVYRSEWWTTWILERPFSNEKEACDYIRKCIDRLAEMSKDSVYTFFGELNVGTQNVEDPIEAYRNLQAKLDNVLLLPTESPVGLDVAYHRLGMELFTYAYAQEPELVSEWLEALNKHEVERVDRSANAKVAPVALVHADLACKNGPMFSPEFLRREFFPRLDRLVRAWHERGVKVIFHSDGDYLMLLDNFEHAGVDGVNPIEKLEGKDHLKETRDGWPDFTLMGGIDSSNLLPYGTKEEVENAVKCALDAAKPGGRYILGSTTEIHPACKSQNVLAMWDAALAYGRY
ncbi:MAG TPA: hypothetical protein HPP83_02735 [Candidatus Hydrogenedentes bacterium]|nr:hypothetical protein [Candidatus Hydrogenedentota bacterium]